MRKKMEFCAVICEYNPFHNGHRRQLAEMREKSGKEGVLCLMSGNFTQRGEAAVFDKYTRARHAVDNGADVVLELPAAFACAPAELFAEGAVHILGRIPAVTALAFGCESGDRESFLKTASALLTEDKAFKAALKENMKDGTSYIRARNAALLATTDADESLLTSPNNLLGAEYCRAILAGKYPIEPIPLLRVGGGYADTALYRDFSSAAALRAVLGDGSGRAQRALKRNLPASVFSAAKNYRPIPYAEAALCALVTASAEQIAETPDCSEGLENRLKALSKGNPTLEGILEKATNKRYTRSRLKRILLQNFLGIRLKDVREYLKAPLAASVLAVKKERADDILASLGGTAIVRKSDYALLKKEALACFETDVRANDLYAALSGAYTGDYLTQFI